MCRISSGSKNDISYPERTGENCLFKIRSDRLGHPEKGNKGQAMRKICKYDPRHFLMQDDEKNLLLMNEQTGMIYDLQNLQPERLRRVDAEKRSDSLNSTNE